MNNLSEGELTSFNLFEISAGCLLTHETLFCKGELLDKSIEIMLVHVFFLKGIVIFLLKD